MDHGGSWDGSRRLEISFVSSICFLTVRLVSGVFGWLDGAIYLLACPWLQKYNHI